MSETPDDLVLVGLIQKPYGLLGEIKVKPETFNFERHTRFKKVYCRDRGGDVAEMTVRGSRADAQFWYLKFENCRTPESVAHLSGRQLLVGPEERLELPPGMVYFADLPGLSVVDEKGERLGVVVEVRESGTQEYLVIRATRGDVSVPWNDHFVKRIDLEGKQVELDVTALRGILF